MSQPYLGQTMIFAGTFAPVGWAFCNGQLLSISQNDALYALIGTTYGGDGVNTFALPNMQGRLAVHRGQGPGPNTFTLGQMGGQEYHTLITTEMPAHTHPLLASNLQGDQVLPANNVMAESNQGVNIYTDAAPDVPMNINTLTPQGGGQPHENMQPFLVMNVCIALTGLFPSQG